MVKEKITAEELKAELRAHPEELDLNEWGQVLNCGTTYCIGGRVLVMAGYRQEVHNLFGIVTFYDDDGNAVWPSEVAAKILGLEPEPALFDTSRWPLQILRPPPFGATSEQVLDAVIKAIDYFCPPQ